MGLKKGAVPSIFPNFTSYLTDATASCQRLSLYDKEERRMHEAYQKSLEEFKETEAKFYTVRLFIRKQIHGISPACYRLI